MALIRTINSILQRQLFLFAIVLVSGLVVSSYVDAQDAAPAKDQQVVSDPPLDKPGRSVEEILSWTKVAVGQALRLEPTDFPTATQSFPTYFTKEGWESFQQVLAKERLAPTLPPLATRVDHSIPIITKKGIMTHTYVWIIRFTREGPITNGSPTREEFLELKVRRVPKAEAPDGVAISSFIIVSSIGTKKTPLPSPVDDSGCSTPPGTPVQAIFQGLKGVNLFVDIHAGYKEALDCHGREEQCVPLAGGYGSPKFDQTKYIQGLRDRYRAYPKALYPDNLTTLLRQRLEKFWSPFVGHAGQCQVNVLSRENIFKAVYIPDTLTMTVRVDVFDSTVPRIAVLSKTLFRPDGGHSIYDDSRPYITAVPLDQGTEEITRQLTQFINHATAAPSIKEGNTY